MKKWKKWMHVKKSKDFGGNAKVCYEAMNSLLCVRTSLAFRALYGQKSHLIRKEDWWGGGYYIIVKIAYPFHSETAHH